MTSDRTYRKALTKEKVIEQLIKGKRTQFDPKLVEAFTKIIEDSMKNKDIHISV